MSNDFTLLQISYFSMYLNILHINYYKVNSSINFKFKQQLTVPDTKFK